MFFRYNLIPFCWIMIVSLLILAPGKDMPTTGEMIGLDKIAHFAVFGIEVLLIAVGFGKQNMVVKLSRSPVMWATVVTLAHNFVLECTQLLIPDRQFDAFDLVANCTGIIAGTTIFWVIYKF